MEEMFLVKLLVVIISYFASLGIIILGYLNNVFTQQNAIYVIISQVIVYSIVVVIEGYFEG